MPDTCETCRWFCMLDTITWEGQCESGGPGDPWNRIKYCQYCGGLVEVGPQGSGEEE